MKQTFSTNYAANKSLQFKSANTSSIQTAHNKRRSDCTVLQHDYLSKWNVDTRKFKPVLKKSK